MLDDLMEVAAAYLSYLCRNQASVDGNKRTALGARLVFLDATNLLPDLATPTRHMDNWEKPVLDVAALCLNRQPTTNRPRAVTAGIISFLPLLSVYRP